MHCKPCSVLTEHPQTPQLEQLEISNGGIQIGLAEKTLFKPTFWKGDIRAKIFQGTGFVQMSNAWACLRRGRQLKCEDSVLDYRSCISLADVSLHPGVAMYLLFLLVPGC